MFYMHRRYGERSLVLRLRIKDGVEVIEGVGYFVRPSVKLRSRSGSFSPGIGPPKHDIFIFYMRI